LIFIQGNQLRRDLNVIVGTGRNWNIPTFWPVLLRYISAPILAIIFGFAYPAFYQLRYDPLHIVGFTVAHFVLIIITLGFILPRWYDVFIPFHRREDGDQPTLPNVTKGNLDGESDQTLEPGMDSGSSDQEKVGKNNSEPAFV